jgi:hypothetical protein
MDTERIKMLSASQNQAPHPRCPRLAVWQTWAFGLPVGPSQNATEGKKCADFAKQGAAIPASTRQYWRNARMLD